MRVAVTGANGHLGIRLIENLLRGHEVRAIVRSGNARSKLQLKFEALDIAIVDYTSEQDLVRALQNCDVAVHLVGIIKQSSTSSFEAAHESSCRSLLAAAKETGIRRIIYLSIVGTRPDSRNTCLASKARAEQILVRGDIPADIIKVPMVLGEGDFASYALKKNARSGFPVTFRADSLEQPIYAGDVINALRHALQRSGGTNIIRLAGTESLTRRKLIGRAADIMGTSPVVLSLPLWLGFMMAWLLEWLPNPPLTRAMLGVLDHDDDVEVEAGCRELDIVLTPLDDMLAKVLS